MNVPKIRRLVKRGLRQAGYQLVRVGKQPQAEPVVQAGDVDGLKGRSGPSKRFFPRGSTDGLWHLPAEWSALANPETGPRFEWVRVLAALYADPASWPASISPEGGSFLYWFIRNVQPRRVIEVGTCLGASTLWISAALRELGGERAIHCFDDFTLPVDARLAASPLFRDRLQGVQTRLAHAGLSQAVRFHPGDSKVELPRARGSLMGAGGVDFAFIDGDHSTPGVTGDFIAVEPILNVGGYVLLHDVFPRVCGHYGPRWLVNHLGQAASGRYQVCDIYTAPVNYGLSLLRRVG